jgi:hypothetical protein
MGAVWARHATCKSALELSSITSAKVICLIIWQAILKLVKLLVRVVVFQTLLHASDKKDQAANEEAVVVKLAVPGTRLSLFW